MEDPATEAREVARGMLGVGIFLLLCGGVFVAAAFGFARLTNNSLLLQIDLAKTKGAEKTLELTYAAGLLVALAGGLQFVVGLVYGFCATCRRYIGNR